MKGAEMPRVSSRARAGDTAAFLRALFILVISKLWVLDLFLRAFEFVEPTQF